MILQIYRTFFSFMLYNELAYYTTDEVIAEYKYFSKLFFDPDSYDESKGYGRLEFARHNCLRASLNNVDRDFTNAFDEFLEYLNEFNRSIRIDSTFLRKNFLQLNVFYRQVSY